MLDMQSSGSFKNTGLWGDCAAYAGGYFFCARGSVSVGQDSNRQVSGVQPLLVGLLTGRD